MAARERRIQRSPLKRLLRVLVHHRSSRVQVAAMIVTLGLVLLGIDVVFVVWWVGVMAALWDVPSR